MATARANRLAGETSPYLLQHAHNPVDWYPWGPEAIARAKAEDRPILLSIGYAACHWCHVMERESFEDEATAALMNEHFVCIKVDREERPDLDAIYMDAVQAMTGQRRMAPDGVPDAGRRAVLRGHVLPAACRSTGCPSFPQVLGGIAEAWTERRDEVVTQGAKIAEHIARVGMLSASEEPLTDEITRAAFSRLREAFDDRTRRLRRRAEVPTADDARVRAPMRRARVGAGVARSSRPRSTGWPTAGSTTTSAAGSHATRRTRRGTCRTSRRCSTTTPSWRGSTPGRGRSRATTGTDAWRRRRSSTCSARCSTPRAGSSRRRTPTAKASKGSSSCGRWDELVALVGPAVATCFGATPSGNWEGTNVLWRPRAIADVAAEHGLPADELAAEVEDARRMLFEIREGAGTPGHGRQGPDRMERAGDRRARRGRPRVRRAVIRARGRSLRGVRPDPPARRTRTAAAFAGGTARRAARVRRRLRHHGGGVSHPLRDHVRAPVVRGGGDAGRRVASSVPRRRTRRLLPDGFRRRGARSSPEGAVRQRDAVREFGGGGDAPASRVVHGRRGGTSEPGFPRSA